MRQRMIVTIVLLIITGLGVSLMGCSYGKLEGQKEYNQSPPLIQPELSVEEIKKIFWGNESGGHGCEF